MSLKVDRGRTRARSQAMQLLFQAEALDVPLDDVIHGDYLLSTGPLEDYAVVLAEGCYDNLHTIDHVLEDVLTNWSLDRLPGTDRNLLRIAVFEMRLADELIGDAIVINEAVEIAKAYGTDESSRFINGVLGHVADMKELPHYDDDVEDEEDPWDVGDGDAEPEVSSDPESETGAGAVASGTEAID